MKTCNNCRNLFYTSDCVSVCEFDYTDLNSDFLDVEQSCPNHQYKTDSIRFELIK